MVIPLREALTPISSACVVLRIMAFILYFIHLLNNTVRFRMQYSHLTARNRCIKRPNLLQRVTPEIFGEALGTEDLKYSLFCCISLIQLILIPEIIF